MKRLIIFALIITMLSGLTVCTSGSSDDLMKGVPGKAQAVQPDMKSGAAAAADFGVRLFQTSLEDGKNTLISPLSVLYALAMTANGADGDTLAQMELVLGMDCANLNEFMLAYMDLLPQWEDCKLNLANAIWFKDDPNFEVEQDFLQNNADYYRAGIYKAPFDDSTKQDINDWVKEHTAGMIPQILDEIPEEAVMYLVNALAFEAVWQVVYEEYQVRPGIFTREDGTQTEIELMHSEERRYLEDELATGFIKHYTEGRYAFAALLPKEGVSVQDYVESLTGAHLLELLSDPEEIMVLAAMPKFETAYDIEMSEVLKEMGMSDAFDWRTADFSRLGSYHAYDVNIVINRVLHKTFLSVGEQGTKAGAATAVEMVAEGAMEIPEYKTVTLDRPFVYLLIDCETNLPSFIGTMMDVNGG